MEYKDIILKKEERIATVVLNRPERGNALTVPMLGELQEALNEVDIDKEVRVLILTGAGKGFCGGGDISEMDEVGPDSRVEPEKIRQLIVQQAQGITRILQRMEIPTIAMVNGFAVGGGFDYACACDIRIGSEKSKFASAFIGVGLVPETGGGYLLPRIVGLSKALEILYTGKWVGAEEAEGIGLLNKLVPAGELERETMEMATQLARAAPVAIGMTRHLVYSGLGTDLETALQMAAAYQAIATYTEDHREGVAAWKEKREPVYRGL